MSKKKIYLITLIVVILAALSVLFFYYRPFNKEAVSNKTIANNEAVTSSQGEYTNKKGQEWKLDEKTDFTVSSAPGARISFLEGKIDPLKVHPGDTQKMRIVVKADNGVKSVIANIETDNGINKVELKKTGVVSVKDLDPSIFTYVVDKNNELQILSTEEAQVYRQKEIAAESNSLINSAQAGTGEREVWEASWLVKDTSVKEYNTTFIATDSQGNQDKLVLAWSDPCKDNTGADWRPNAATTTLWSGFKGDCAIASVYGVDGGNLVVDTNTITLQGGGELIFNPGQSIKMTNNGSIAINQAGSPKGAFKKGFIWALDNDGDGFAATDTRLYNNSSTTPPQAGYQRQNSLSTTTLDCYDSNKNAYPGQKGFFTTQRGDGSFDYNCDGQIQFGHNICTGTASGAKYYDYADGNGFYHDSHLKCNQDFDCQEVTGNDGATCLTGYCCSAAPDMEFCRYQREPIASECGGVTRTLVSDTVIHAFNDPTCTPGAYNLGWFIINSPLDCH